MPAPLAHVLPRLAIDKADHVPVGSGKHLAVRGHGVMVALTKTQGPQARDRAFRKRVPEGVGARFLFAINRFDKWRAGNQSHSGNEETENHRESEFHTLTPCSILCELTMRNLF